MLREQEHERAGLAGVRGWDVEVEDGADLWRDGAVVGSAIGGGGFARVNWDDEVRVLVLSVEVGRARSSRWRSWA